MGEPGLVDRILSAESEGEIDSLLAKGKRYEFASSRTRRHWTRNAKKARARLAVEKVKLDAKNK